MMRPLILAFLLLLAACVDSGDPADGGFINGVSGITTGTYDARIEEREEEVAAAKVRNAELTAELNRLRGDHASVKNQIVQRRSALAAKGIRLSPQSERQVQSALRANPERGDSLRKAIADARILSERLARMANS